MTIECFNMSLSDGYVPSLQEIGQPPTLASGVKGIYRVLGTLA